MNLLPKNTIDFASTEYWDKFFKKRGTKEFEWYGEYEELCGYLHKYLKKEDSVLVIGCGNSMLSTNLFDLGFKKITNIDISSVVIKQMKSKVGSDRPELIFEQMDVLNMSFEKEKFSAVLDKGTLDALLPSDSDDDKKRAQQLFSEVDRVLKANGRYIIFSLLQDHVLKEILKYFAEQKWMIRISRCWDVERKKIKETGSLTMPVFMIVCVKFKMAAQSVLEVNVLANGKPQRVNSVEAVLGFIEGVQQTIVNFKESKGEVEINFCKNGESESKYTIFVVDVSQDQRQLLTYAAFIVPHGRESEWMFGTPEGRSYLRDSSGFDRLAIVTFHRNQEYGTMEEIQDELRQTILQLAPCLMKTAESPNESPKVPYLSLGDGVGRRRTIFSGKSEYSGELVVEEVEIEKETFRRLIFMSNQAVVQTEVKLKKKKIDFTHVASKHILFMSIPAAMKPTMSPSIAIVGLGGGSLCLFLQRLFPSASITGVEIDPLVVQLAKDYFGLETNEKLKIIVDDGVKFLKKKLKFDIIIFDVDSKERGAAVSCPPPQFLEPELLKAVADSLGDEGIFVTNVVTRVNAEFEKVKKKIEKHFSLVAYCNLKEDVNKIIFASNKKNLAKTDWKTQIENGGATLEKLAEKKFKENEHLMELSNLIYQMNI